MMVKGVGTDLVEVARLQRSIDQRGDDLAKRILTESEFNAYQASSRPAVYLAKRFAVKEAVSKALGTGISKGVRWQDIELARLDSGQPYVTLCGKAQAKLEDLDGQGVFVSLSDEAGLVSAFAVLG